MRRWLLETLWRTSCSAEEFSLVQQTTLKIQRSTRDILEPSESQTRGPDLILLGKKRDRNVWDFTGKYSCSFQLAEEMTDSRIVAAVQTTPRRLTNVESAIQGQPKNEQTAQSVMQMATDGARALAHNGFKIPLMQNLVKRAISA